MAIGKDGAVLRQLHTLFNVGTIRELTDGQLLERFATDRGEAGELAFAALVERHGPMVLRICRSVLADPHDTQDAFQATFLVLVKRARALWVRDSLGPWLHQVAYRTASCARTSAARRRRLERGAAGSKESRDVVDQELARVLHEEVERLPERYRAPVVLCDLEGCTHEQAARHLGWPVGTVKSRQSRARERLRERLQRRGLAPNAGLLAAAMRPPNSAAPLPAALVDSTAGAAARFLATRTLVPGSAAALAQGVLRSMFLARCWKLATALLVLGTTASGVVLLAQEAAPGARPQAEEKAKAARAADVPTVEIQPSTLRVTVADRGVLEASRTDSVHSEIEGQTTIIFILPEGSRVKKGDKVAELDSASLRDQLTNQWVTIRKAEAEYQRALKDREIAEIAVKEYVQGNLPQQRKALEGEITAAQSAIQKAEARLKRTQGARQRVAAFMTQKGDTATPADIVAELDVEDRVAATEQALLREKSALDAAQAKQQILEKYSATRVEAELGTDVERKKSHELAKLATLNLEKAREAKLKKQIEKCKLLAPHDGMVIWANDLSRLRGQQMIEEGATVRERQAIFYLPDLSSPMRVNAKTREAVVHWLTPGQRARIKVEALPKETLTGVVKVVAPLPDPSSFFREDRKVYTTIVSIEDGPPSLRPGMVADVEILTAELQNVLTVPLTAVINYDGKYRIAVKAPDGGIDWREVTLGMANDTHIEIKQGLRRGEAVALDPLALMSEQEKREKNARTLAVPSTKAQPPKASLEYDRPAEKK